MAVLSHEWQTLSQPGDRDRYWHRHKIAERQFQLQRRQLRDGLDADREAVQPVAAGLAGEHVDVRAVLLDRVGSCPRIHESRIPVNLVVAAPVHSDIHKGVNASVRALDDVFAEAGKRRGAGRSRIDDRRRALRDTDHIGFN